MAETEPRLRVTRTTKVMLEVPLSAYNGRSVQEAVDLERSRVDEDHFNSLSEMVAVSPNIENTCTVEVLDATPSVAFVRVNGQWRFEGFLNQGFDLASFRERVEAENGPGSYCVMQLS